MKNNTIEPGWVSHTIKYIQQYSEIGQNVTNEKLIQSQDDLNRIKNGLISRPNQTQIGIFFCVDNIPLLSLICNQSTNSSRSYYMYINKTDSFGTIFAAPSVPLPVDFKAARLKVLIDNGILDYSTGGLMSPPKMGYNYTQYPVVPNRFIKGFDIITQTGAFYYMITPLFAFLFIQNEIVREKEYKLRQGTYCSYP
jgi:hypothetical protein